MFERKTLKQLQVRIQLGHWHEVDRVCPLPKSAAEDDFVIIDIHGVHEVGLDYCGCGASGLPTQQLLRARLWSATTTNPRTAATFAVLRKFHLMSFESKCAALEFYQSLARESNNLKYKKDKVRVYNHADVQDLMSALFRIGSLSRVFADDEAMAPRPDAQACRARARPGRHRPNEAGRMCASMPRVPTTRDESPVRVGRCPR